MRRTMESLTFLIFARCINGNKYCAFEIDGEAKYYVCPKNEYCCNLGCCVNLAFQFYQMWYYWLLLIIMFMICSGGGWWYRFCRQSEGSTYPTSMVTQTDRATVSSSTSGGHRLIDQTNRRSRVIHNLSIDHSSLYLQHIWKGHQSNFQPPPYYNNGSSVMYHNTSSSAATDPRSPNYRCPYYQLYGPPPSYDSVVQITNPSNTGERQTCIVLSSSHAAVAGGGVADSGGAIETTATTATTNDYQQPSTSTLSTRSEDNDDQTTNQLQQIADNDTCNNSDQSETTTNQINVRKNISNISTNVSSTNLQIDNDANSTNNSSPPLSVTTSIF